MEQCKFGAQWFLAELSVACGIVPIGLPQTRRPASREEDRDRNRGGDVSTRVNIDDNKTCQEIFGGEMGNVTLAYPLLSSRQ